MKPGPNTPLQGQRRRQILTYMHQPVTAVQLARRLRISLDSCSALLSELTILSLTQCLNRGAVRSRLYWLTSEGREMQQTLRTEQHLPILEHDFPRVDWDLLGWVCYSHRSAILKALNAPLQPATIKRRARSILPSLRMSANNTRDNIRLFLKKGIVTRVYMHKRAHARYELTDEGAKLRQLVLGAEAPLC